MLFWGLDQSKITKYRFGSKSTQSLEFSSTLLRSACCPRPCCKQEQQGHLHEGAGMADSPLSSGKALVSLPESEPGQELAPGDRSWPLPTLQKRKLLPKVHGACAVPGRRPQEPQFFSPFAHTAEPPVITHTFLAQHRHPQPSPCTHSTARAQQRLPLPPLHHPAPRGSRRRHPYRCCILLGNL